DTFSAGTPSCGASGSFVGPIVFDSSTGDGSFDCRFADDNPTATASDTSTVSITITDDDTGAGTGSKDVTVNNVAPSVADSGALNVAEGSAPTYSSDPAAPASPDTFTPGAPACGTASYVPLSLVFGAASGDGSFDCHFSDDDPTGTASDPATIKISISD